MPFDDPQSSKWDPRRPEIHVRGDADCECWAHTAEFREGIAQATEDVRSGHVFRASASDLEQLGDGRLTVHDIHLREAIQAFEAAAPRETGANP